MSNATSPPEVAVPPFGARLQAALRRHGPLCVGVDPAPATLVRWGLTDDVAGLERFCGTVVEALAGRTAMLKPQVAFFERHGSRGLAVLERLLADCRSAGQLVLADAKRGDIGSTAAGYADAWLDPRSPLAADAVTVSPFLGYGSLAPLVDAAAAHGRGVFVLCLTSNPEGASVQHARPADGSAPSVAAAVAAAAAADNARLGDGPPDDARPDDASLDDAGRSGLRRPGPVGLVVGATVGEQLAATGVDLAAVGGHLLLPGLGAQGATAQDVARHLGALAELLVPSASREVLNAGPDRQRLRDGAARLTGDLASALGV
ncbi:orotidine-5'-phosphate decarboxylase [Aquipuribacter sp. MA13-6]|uniref:orotidine-5'-phosphate decarboxylase n=1 Tax=unclassified Aquipuribacter TaxID=2635084 RepID=UPI003EEE8A3E